MRSQPGCAGSRPPTVRQRHWAEAQRNFISSRRTAAGFAKLARPLAQRTTRCTSCDTKVRARTSNSRHGRRADKARLERPGRSSTPATSSGDLRRRQGYRGAVGTAGQVYCCTLVTREVGGDYPGTGSEKTACEEAARADHRHHPAARLESGLTGTGAFAQAQLNAGGSTTPS